MANSFNTTSNTKNSILKYKFLPWITDTQFNIRRLSDEFLLLVLVWIIEWGFIIEFLIGEWWRENVLYPTKIPLGLILCTGYWFFMWIMSVWRRTQYGKFTRGDRILWAKGITSFWVFEIVTIFAFVLVYMWLSWGPQPLVPRIFNISRKGIIIELIIFSYLIFLTYIAKLTMKWNTWKTQVTLSLIILLIFSYLLWKDVLLLLMRDNLYLHHTARWRNIRKTAVIYTLSHEWWTQHMTTIRAPHSLYNILDYYISNNTKPDFTSAPAILQYEYNSFVETTTTSQRVKYTMPVLNWFIDYTPYYNNLSNTYIQTGFYPRRTGYVPKRLGLWQLLVALKMWHHLIILLWLTIYLFRLNTRKKTSYTILSTCYFNIYCCLLLTLMIYSIYMFNTWALFFKFRPGVFNIHRWLLWTHQSIIYNFRLIFSSSINTCSYTLPYLL